MTIYFINLEYCVEAWITRNAKSTFKNMFILTDMTELYYCFSFWNPCIIFPSISLKLKIEIEIEIENIIFSKTQLRPGPTCMWLILPDQISTPNRCLNFDVETASKKVRIFRRQYFDVRRRFDASVFQRFLLDVWKALKNRSKSIQLWINIEKSTVAAGRCLLHVFTISLKSWDPTAPFVLDSATNDKKHTLVILASIYIVTSYRSIVVKTSWSLIN